LKPVQEEKYPR